jgi:hypothetical protein
MEIVKKSVGIIGRVLAALIGDPDMKTGSNINVMWNDTTHISYL